MRTKWIAVLVAAAEVGCGTLEPIQSSRSTDEMLGELADLVQSMQPAEEAAAGPRAPVEEIREDLIWLHNEEQQTYFTEAQDAVSIVIDGRAARWELLEESEGQFVQAPREAATKAEHLDYITSQADWEWEIENGVVVIRDRVTRSYGIGAMPGERTATVPFRALTTNTQQTGGAAAQQVGQGQGGEEEAENNLNIEYDGYEQLREALDALLMAEGYGAGGRNNLLGVGSAAGALGAGAGQGLPYSLVPSANLLVVTAKPSTQRIVAALVGQFNEAVLAKARITLTVFEVEFRDSAQRAVDVQLLRDAGEVLGLSVDGNNLLPPGDNGIRFTGTQLNRGAFDLVNVVASLLELQGRTTVRLHEAFEAVNNVVMSISDERVQPYIAEVSLSGTSGGSLLQFAPEIDSEEVSTGLAFHVLTNIAGENVNVRLSLSQSALIRFDEYRFGGGASEIAGRLPVTDQQHRLIRMSLRDGETRLVANLTASEISEDESTQGLGFGLSRSSTENHTQTVIAVTAEIL